MRCLAIGDIHGCINSLETLLSAVDPGPGDTMVTLGDYINRGPNSRANAYADYPLEEQPVYMLRWEPFEDPLPHESGRIMVCGHTPRKTGRPRNLGHAICIDTRAYRGGWLTCLDTRSGKVWQANEQGDVRRGHIDGFLESP